MSILRTESLGKWFPSGDRKRWVNQGITYSFPDVGLIAIRGHSGSGKSTFLNLLCGYEKPSKGKIFYRGKNIALFSQKEKTAFHREGIAMVFQHYQLISGASALYNVMLPGLINGQTSVKEKALALLARFGLGKLAQKKVDCLSGGEKQRIAICRALLNSPRVLLADEPTGALDEENARIVMEMLTEIGKERLVIMVSHNDELIERYGQGILRLEGGKLIEEKQRKTQGFNCKTSQKSKTKHHWTWRFTLRNLKKNAFKNILGFCAGIIGFSSLLVCLGFFVGSQSETSEAKSRSLEYPFASIAKKTRIEISNSPLSLVQKTRPDLDASYEALQGIPSAEVKNDYSYFLPSASGFTLRGAIQDPVMFLPVFDLTLTQGAELIQEGSVAQEDDLSQCYVNRAFADAFPEAAVGETIHIDVEAIAMEGTAKDVLAYSLDFSILGIAEEFAFLNQPKVYYSYSALEAFLESLELPYISAARGKQTNVRALVETSPDDSYLAGFDRWVFVHDRQDVPLLFERIKELNDDISISSSAAEVMESFSSLTEAFAMSLLLFVGIAVVGVVLVTAMTSFSSFVSRKKETAILFVLGASSGEVRTVFVQESLLVALLSSIGALLLSPFPEYWINRFLSGRFGMERMIQIPFSSLFGIPYLLFLLLPVAAMIIAFLSTVLPLEQVKKVSLSQELKEE